MENVANTQCRGGYVGVLAGVGVSGEPQIVVFRVLKSRITHVWVGDDVENITEAEGMTQGDLEHTKTFVGDVLEVLSESYDMATMENSLQLHLNDYTNIPVVG